MYMLYNCHLHVCVFILCILLLSFAVVVKVPHQHQHAAIPVIIDEAADEDILLDTQRPCYVKEEKILLALL